MNPLRGWVALSFVSHKLFRWFCPFFLVGAFAANALVSDGLTYAVTLAMQVVLYLVAVAGYVSPRLGSVSRVAKLPTMFAAMNLALLAGFFMWASGRQTGVWTRTARTDG